MIYLGAFSMAVLALKMATFSNGVAQLHGVVSRQMFQGLWQKVPVEEVPIAAITNGVHARSCVAKSTQELYDRYLAQIGHQHHQIAHCGIGWMLYPMKNCGAIMNAAAWI